MSGFNRGMGNISTALIRAPLMRQQAALMQARMAEQQQMAQETAARTALLNKQSGQIDYGNSKLNDYADKTAAFDAARSALQDNPSPENKAAYDKAEAAFMGTAADVKQMPISDFFTAMQKSSALRNTLGGGPVATSGALVNPASIANNQADNAEKSARPIVAPNNSTVFSAAGQPVATAATTLAPGQDRFAPSTNISSALQQVAQGQPLPDKSSAADQQAAILAREAIMAANKDGSGAVTNSPGNIMSQFKQVMPAPAAPAAQPSALPASGAPAAPAAQAAPAAPQFNSAMDVKAAYNAGKLDRATAQQILQSQFGMQ